LRAFIAWMIKARSWSKIRATTSIGRPAGSVPTRKRRSGWSSSNRTWRCSPVVQACSISSAVRPCRNA